MYNPLVKIIHNEGSESYVRASEIKSIEKWSNHSKIKTPGLTYNMVTNIDEIVTIVNNVEDRNELTQIMKT